MVSAKQPASLADELLRGDLDCGGAVFAGFPSSKDASELVATVTKEAKQAIIEAAPVFRRSGAGPHARRSCPRSRGSRLRRGCRRRRSVPCSSSRSSSSSLVVAPPLAVAPPVSRRAAAIATRRACGPSLNRSRHGPLPRSGTGRCRAPARRIGTALGCYHDPNKHRVPAVQQIAKLPNKMRGAVLR